MPVHVADGYKGCLLIANNQISHQITILLCSKCVLFLFFWPVTLNLGDFHFPFLFYQTFPLTTNTEQCRFVASGLSPLRILVFVVSCKRKLHCTELKVECILIYSSLFFWVTAEELWALVLGPVTCDLFTRESAPGDSLGRMEFELLRDCEADFSFLY